MQSNNHFTEIEEQIQTIMNELNFPITSISGLDFRMAAMILTEVGDFNRFDSPDKLLAMSGCFPIFTSPDSSRIATQMENRESMIPLLCTLQRNQICLSLRPDFFVLPRKKQAEGKYYNAALSHTDKKLVWLMFAMEKFSTKYRWQLNVFFNS